MDQKLGLPDVLGQLIMSENVNYGDKFKWKVICNQDFTQVTLIWDKQASSHNRTPVTSYHDQGQNSNRQTDLGYKQKSNQYYGYVNNRNYQRPIPGYRKKSPSELKRDQERKLRFKQNCDSKRRHSGKGESKTADAETQCSPIDDQIQDTSCDTDLNVNSEPTDNGKNGVTTRSMAQLDSVAEIETPRDSSMMSVSLMMSPESVRNESHSDVSDNPLDISHQDDSLVSDSDSEPGESDPVLAPGCFNDQCSYGGGPGSRRTNINVYNCVRCGTSVCKECYDEGTAHSGHRRYMKLVVK